MKNKLFSLLILVLVLAFTATPAHALCRARRRNSLPFVTIGLAQLPGRLSAAGAGRGWLGFSPSQVGRCREGRRWLPRLLRPREYWNLLIGNWELGTVDFLLC